MEKSMQAALILENGTTMKGRAFGYPKEAIGEIVFTTQSAGYQELISDPVNAGKLLMFTYPLVGNTGISLDDMEAAVPRTRGVIIREKCDMPNNWRNEMDLDSFLKQHKIIGIEGIDTRALMRIIRHEGRMIKGIITTRGDSLTPAQIRQNLESHTIKNIVREITCAQSYETGSGKRHIAVLDLGVSQSVVKELAARTRLTVFPAFTQAKEILAAGADAVYISNGPGKPFDCEEITSVINELIGKTRVFGCGLGYQLVLIACGARLSEMKLGHHGGNYPVKSLDTGKILITTQNNDYFVDYLPGSLRATHIGINDGNIEGAEHSSLPVSGIQFVLEGKIYDRIAGGTINAQEK